ncbi:MAG: hypothetical protein WDM81_13900 [Rhizomicrobium sp.]
MSGTGEKDGGKGADAGAEKGGAEKGGAEKGGAEKGEKSLLDLADDVGSEKDKGGDKGADKGAAGAPYKPDGLPDDLLGKDDKETIDKLAARAKGLRDQLAKKGGTPVEKADDYEIALPEDVAKLIDVASEKNKPVFDAVRAAALKAGLPKETLGTFMTELTGALNTAGLLKPAADPVKISGETEFKAMVKIAGGEKEARALLKDEKSWVKNLVDGKVLSAEEGAVVAVDFMGTAKGWEVLRKLRAHFTGKELPPHQVEPDVVANNDVIKARYADPRQKTDPAWRAETERMLRAQKAAEKHGKS